MLKPVRTMSRAGSSKPGDVVLSSGAVRVAFAPDSGRSSKTCPSTREIILAAREQNLIENRNPVRPRLLPGLTRKELDEFSRSLAVPPSDDVRDLLQFCSGNGKDARTGRFHW